MTKATLFKVTLILVFLSGIILRLYYMLAPLTKLSFDEAVYAVQAMNIMHGEVSVFYYNQPYTGTLQAYFSAIFYALFGVSEIWAKFVPFLFSMAFLITNYILARQIFGAAKWGLVTLILTAFTSTFWLNWTTRAGSGYSEMMVLGNLSLIFTIMLIWGKNSVKKEALLFFLLGLSSGIGFWIQPAIVYYLAPIALFFIIKRPKVFLEPRAYLTVVGFAVGALPVIIWNLSQNGSTLRSVINKPDGIKQAWINFFLLGVPVLLGVRAPSRTEDFLIPLSWVVYLIYALACAYLLIKRAKEFFKEHFLKKEDLIIFLTISIPLFWSVTPPFNLFIIEPRYVSPLYTPLPMIIVFLIKEIVKLNWGKYLALLILSVLVFSSVYGYLKKPPDSYLTQYKLDEVISYLKNQGIKYVWADFEFSYRLILETKGEIIAASFDSAPGRARYPKYAALVEKANGSEKAFVLTPQFKIPLSPCEEDVFKQTNPCKSTQVGRFVVYTWR